MLKKLFFSKFNQNLKGNINLSNFKNEIICKRFYTNNRNNTNKLINLYKQTIQKNQYSSKLDIKVDMDIPPRSTISFFIKDYPGSLCQVLKTVEKYDINLTRIESRFVQDYEQVKFRIDTDSPYRDLKIKKLMRELQTMCISVELEQPRKVPWFPVTMEQMDELATLVLAHEGAFEKTNVPTFTDQEYIKRRNKIAQAAMDYKYPDPPQRVDYAPEEIECWGTIWKALKPLLEKHACDEYWEVGKDLHKECNYTENNIPQLSEVNEFIESRTGFRLRPTAGLLSSRHFLNGLAFKTFFCTQYIRHPFNPFYTPEPDVVHELVGHAPLFADKNFAKFSQEIGLASIGATDDEINELARCYWFSVEFGICKSNKNENENKIYGAGILSSVDEIKNAMLYEPMKETGEYPEIRPWNPFVAAHHPFPITRLQPIYYLAESFVDATNKMHRFTEYLDKRFSVTWNEQEKQLIADGNIYRDDKTNELGTYGG